MAFEKYKTLGPYRVSIRFATGEEWSFMLEDLTHARMMDEFFTRFMSPAAPGVTGLNITDATGIIWRGL